MKSPVSSGEIVNSLFGLSLYFLFCHLGSTVTLRLNCNLDLILNTCLSEDNFAEEGRLSDFLLDVQTKHSLEGTYIDRSSAEKRKNFLQTHGSELVARYLNENSASVD